jgi:uncharacterized protein DUF2800
MTEQTDEREGKPSASAWHRYELCAGSWQLEQEARRLGQLAHERSVDAAKGDRIHATLAQIPDEDGQVIKLSESEQTTADFLAERGQGEVQRIFGDEPTLVINEQRLWLSYQGKKALSGRFDRVVYTPTKALVQDFKTGFSEPDPAEQNPQLKVLAVLVGLHLPAVEEVIVQIISGPYGVFEARYDVAGLGAAYHSIIVTLRALHDPAAALNPSPEACRYCPAKLICPALQEKRITIARADLIPLPDGEQAAMILDDVAVIRSRCDQIIEYYERRLLDDPSYAVPGYAMIPGVVRREVTDWEAARKRLAEWLDLPEIEGAANYRLGELEKALGKKLGLKGKALKERTNQILAGLIEEKQNAASLKRVSHKAESAQVPVSSLLG